MDCWCSAHTSADPSGGDSGWAKESNGASISADESPCRRGPDVGAMVEPDRAHGSMRREVTSEIVRVRAGRLELGGEAWLPRGVNSYPLLQLVGAGSLEAVDDIFAQAVALGRPLIRTPAFLDCGTSPARVRDEAGKLREEGLSALDRLLASAAAHEVRLILILTNNWADFGGAPAVLEMVAPGEGLPKNAFWTDPRLVSAQLAYQAGLATRVNGINGRRYAEDPTILAWELANEARCESAPLLRSSARTLASWARRMSDGLRAAGVKQLISWGGSGGLGRHGEDLRMIAAEGGVDVLTLHMYGSRFPFRTRLSRVGAAIAWGEKTLLERSAVARAAGLPLLLEEVNWKPPRRVEDAHVRDVERARVLSAWLEVAHGLGVGTLPWMIGERGRPDSDGYLIRPEDVATVQVLRRG